MSIEEQYRGVRAEFKPTMDQRMWQIELPLWEAGELEHLSDEEGDYT